MVAAIAVAAAGGGFVLARYTQPSAPAPVAALPGKTTAVEGQMAPALSVTDLDGKPRSLAEWRGRWLLVNFWATWCAPCMEEIPLLVKAQADWADRKLQVLGIAMDDPQAVREALPRLKLNYPTLAGDEPVAAAMEGLGNTLGAIPYSVLLSPEGKIKAVELGGLTATKLHALLDQHLGSP